MESIESEGKTVAEAVEKALGKLGLRRDQVEVHILQEASGGFMGIGAKPARVRIAEKLWGGEPAAARKPTPRESPKSPPAAGPEKVCALAEETLREIARLAGLEALALKTSWDATQERVKIVAEGDDAEKLIGAEGKTLESIQLLATLIVGRKAGAPVAVLVDALGYWEKKEQEILAQARRGIEEVKATGKPFRLPPMDAPMRRLVHRNLAGNPGVETASEGEGSWRKIVLRPRKG